MSGVFSAFQFFWKSYNPGLPRLSESFMPLSAAHFTIIASSNLAFYPKFLSTGIVVAMAERHLCVDEILTEELRTELNQTVGGIWK